MGWLLSWPWWAVVLACWLPFGVLVGLALGRLGRERDRQADAERVRRALTAYERGAFERWPMLNNSSMGAQRGCGCVANHGVSGSVCACSCHGRVVDGGWRAARGVVPDDGVPAEDTIREGR